MITAIREDEVKLLHQRDSVPELELKVDDREIKHLPRDRSDGAFFIEAAVTS